MILVVLIAVKIYETAIWNEIPVGHTAQAIAQIFREKRPWDFIH